MGGEGFIIHLFVYTLPNSHKQTLGSFQILRKINAMNKTVKTILNKLG